MIIKHIFLGFVVAPLIWIFWLHIEHYLSRGKREFVNQLAGTKFKSFEELEKYYWDEYAITFRLDGPFDPNRYGDLQKTLREIDRGAQKVLKKHGVLKKQGITW